MNYHKSMTEHRKLSHNASSLHSFRIKIFDSSKATRGKRISSKVEIFRYSTDIRSGYQEIFHIHMIHYLKLDNNHIIFE